MNLDDYRVTFAVASLVLSLIAASPIFSITLPFSRGEAFSELWLLGPGRMAEGYPFNVKGGELQGPIYIGVRNHVGCSRYYVVYVKFRNKTQPLPNVAASKPSPLPPLYEFQFFLEDGAMWEKPLSFTVEDVLFRGDSAFVGRLSFNGEVFSVNASARWDLECNGFYYQLFFELWLYDMTARSFQYHNRFVGIWLNMTGF